MILVTGATGEFGKHAVQQLIAKGVNTSDISVLSRSLEKANNYKADGITVKIGDYSNYDSLVKAFEGVDKLLFVSSSEIEDRAAQHQNVVKAAKATGVKHIVYTSFMRNQERDDSAIAFLQDSHLKTENWIKESGMTYTFLQNATYMDMLPMFIGEQVMETGVIMQPAQNGKSSLVLRQELAEAAAVVLTSDGHENKEYPLVNNQAITYNEVAETIAQISGKDITYQSPSPEDYQATLKTYGVPDEYIGIFTAFSVAQANGELEMSDNSLEKLLGRKPTTAKEFLTKIYA
ncbi:SDR family oxidoreductase [Brumimicrobium aurantiacum]|uniref:SDR family oxidoreductase n=1 Tax=Brumimicrobium aurantiacum TaxID=1737063 RepID=A0A3E1EX92_9FLAO|nr:SDR family oxidoreductase [Brumimicrobium aurantiacum]RFC54175.1 SDR family oxidoreductase [Brumimicrobium aurantiacum]